MLKSIRVRVISRFHRISRQLSPCYAATSIDIDTYLGSSIYPWARPNDPLAIDFEIFSQELVSKATTFTKTKPPRPSSDAQRICLQIMSNIGITHAGARRCIL